MKELYDLKNKLHRELSEIAEKRDLSAGDLDVVHKLTSSIKNIDKICANDEYSRDGASYGRHWVRGHYSRDGEMDGNSYGNSYGYSNRHYSRGGLADKLRDMMPEATTDRERDELRRMIDKLEG